MELEEKFKEVLIDFENEPFENRVNRMLVHASEPAKAIDSIHKQILQHERIKMYLLIALLNIIWIGYICILNSRNVELRKENKSLKHEKFISDSINSFLQSKCDSAVYFKDIIVK